MEFLQQAIDIILHLDRYLGDLVRDYGGWTYAILFLIVFCETGLVVTPFLPGDSLLFAAGALAATGALNVHAVFVLLIVAAITGDAVNYAIGRRIGPAIFRKETRFIKHAHLERTRQFYEKHGGKTIVLARFLPIIRTFAPFVAGVAQMRYPNFASYNIVGGLLWVALFLYGGFFFGNLPFVKENFSLVILAIIIISVVPVVLEWYRARQARTRAARAGNL
jgi:membrane-associated protein